MTGPGYNLVHRYFDFQPKEDVVVGFAVENVLDTDYVRYLDALPSPGRTLKSSIKVRFGEGFYKRR